MLNTSLPLASLPSPSSTSFEGGPTLRRHRPHYLAVALAALAALIGSACSAGSTAADEVEGPIRLLEPSDFADYMEANPSVAVINVHIPYEGHIEGTDEFVDFTQILDHDGLPVDLDEPVVVYCRSGSMSGQAAAELVAAGHTNVIDLGGGMNAWTASGRDLLTEAPASS